MPEVRARFKALACMRRPAADEHLAKASVADVVAEVTAKLDVAAEAAPWRSSASQVRAERSMAWSRRCIATAGHQGCGCRGTASPRW